MGVALEYARRLEPGGWHVFQNGASIINLTTGQSHSSPLPVMLKNALIRQARSTGETLELYSDSAYVVESTSTEAREHAELLGLEFNPRPFESLMEPIVRAQWLLSRQRATELTSQPHEGLEAAQSSSPLMPDTQFVGLTSAGVTKGNAMKSIADEYGISLEDVMYIGDAPNDLSALRVVGHPIAMGNADPVVLAAAERSVGHVDQGGLAQALALALSINGR